MEEEKNKPFFIASPLRALADYIYIQKVDNPTMHYLTESLRIEEEDLYQIEPHCFIDLQKVYRSKRVLHFLINLQKELEK
jgi:hypothetical protein